MAWSIAATKAPRADTCGGGSGHEPLFLGAVGPGMADGAVAGAVFAAPNPLSIQATAEALGEDRRPIYLYGNYSGDVLNFDFAAEESESEGTQGRADSGARRHCLRAGGPMARAGAPQGYCRFQMHGGGGGPSVCLWTMWSGWARR